MRTILGTAILFLVIFCIVALVANDSFPRQGGIASMEFALQWTIKLFGALTAAISAVGLLLVAAAKGPLERQMSFVLPLLAGLLILSSTWSLALAVGAIAVAWLLRGFASSSANS